MIELYSPEEVKYSANLSSALTLVLVSELRVAARHSAIWTAIIVADRGQVAFLW